MEKDKDFPILKQLFDELDLFFKSMKDRDAGQSKLTETTNPDEKGGGESPSELATDRQRAFMKKLKISFSSDISKDEASRLISKKMEEEK